MSLAQDLRFGLRRLRRAPLFTVAVLATLTLAIAANVTVFSAVRAVLLRPLPIRAPERILLISEASPESGQTVKEVSYRNYVDWRAQSRSFETMAAIGSATSDFVTDLGGQLMRFKIAIVSASFFDVVGTSPRLGRVITPEDDKRHAARVLILSDRLWRDRFNADPNIIGTSITSKGAPFTVIGVMPPEFAYPVGTDAWTAVVPALEASNARWKIDTLERRFWGELNVLGRLAPGISEEQARAELDAIVRRLPESPFAQTTAPSVAAPSSAVGAAAAAGSFSAVVTTPLLDDIFGATRRGVMILFGMVCFVLLIACANVSSLVLARATSLSRAFAVKSALGASRAQLIREWVVEMSCVTLASGALGVGLAWIALRPLLALAPASVPRIDSAHIDVPVLAFALGLCAIVTLLCALVPAMLAAARAARDAVVRVRSSAGTASVLGRGLLTAVQVAFAMLLIAGAGLLVRSFDQLRRIDLGFDPEHVLTLDVEPQAPNTAAYRLAYDAILQRVASLPTVQAAGAVMQRPLTGGRFGLESGYLLEGQTIKTPEARNNVMLNFEAVTPGYFDAMRLRLQRGRTFTPRDTQDAEGVAIVSERTARRLWPGKDAIGQRLSIASSVTEDRKYPMQTVVGVVSEVRYRGIDDARFDVYMPTTQTQHRVKHLMIRTTGDPTTVARSVRAAILDIAPNTIVDDVTTMDAIVSNAVAPWRFSMTLLVGLAVLGGLLAAAGLFALIAYSVNQRTTELAVRQAIGASPATILRMMLWQGTRFALVGLVSGLVLSLLLANRMSPLLFQVSARDTRTFASAAALLAATAFIASYLAARRAIRIDPVSVMRE
jgi:putative ABC transport system permease protein